MLLPRLLAFTGALAAAFLVFLPLPFSDLLVMLPAQLFIALSVLLTSGQPVRPLRLGLGVLVYALLGTLLTGFIANIIPLLGKLFAAPFALVWCYGLGELALSRKSRA